jgi:hypothetical protein
MNDSQYSVEALRKVLPEEAVLSSVDKVTEPVQLLLCNRRFILMVAQCGFVFSDYGT